MYSLVLEYVHVLILVIAEVEKLLALERSRSGFIQRAFSFVSTRSSSPTKPLIAENDAYQPIAWKRMPAAKAYDEENQVSNEKSAQLYVYIRAMAR